MHKKQLIQRGDKAPLKLFDGGLVEQTVPKPGLFSKMFNSNFGKGASSLLSGFSGMPSPMSNLGSNGQPLTEGQLLNRSLGGAAQGIFTGALGLSGIKNSSMNSDQKRMATGDLGVQTLGQVAGAFGPIGMAAGAALGIVNKIGGSLIGTPKSMKDFTLNDQVGKSSGYGGITANANKVMDTNKSYESAGLFGKLFGGKNKLLAKTAESNSQQNQVTQILDMNKNSFAQMGNTGFAERNANKLYGGNSWVNGAIQYGQEGGTLTRSGSTQTKTYEEHSKLLGVAASKIDFKKLHSLKAKTVKKDEPKKFAEGGVLEATNVIVDGALHARKHTLKDLEHLEDAEITLKGIPVVTIDAEGGVIQHAEVEKDELILHHACSKKMEDLYEEGTEEAMIQAGRILAREIMKNTVDSSAKIIENA